MPRYVVYCDESGDRGRYFSNFYGAAIVADDRLSHVERRLAWRKHNLGFNGEVKWNKVTDQYEERYRDLIDEIFNLCHDGLIKFRIVFTSNALVHPSLTEDQLEQQYYILYYQLIKHGLGLLHMPGDDHKLIDLRFDELPTNKADARRFKNYVVALNNIPSFQRKRIEFRRDLISEIRSHEHDVLQALDLVLGAMYFRLNDFHKMKPEGARIRGKRTRAKERIYKHINRRICDVMFPNFNIGISTGDRENPSNRWNHPYRHWLFRPRDAVLDNSRTKRRS